MTTGIIIYLCLVGLVLVGIHLANEWTIADRLWFAKRWFRWFWCALRDHPYPVVTPPRDYEEPMILWEPPYCSNCGTSFRTRRRGMHS